MKTVKKMGDEGNKENGRWKMKKMGDEENKEKRAMKEIGDEEDGKEK